MQCSYQDCTRFDFILSIACSCNVCIQVFSHMADDTFLLQSSVQRMSTLGVIEALALCRQFGMHALALRYSEALVQRLTTSSFIQVGSIS